MKTISAVLILVAYGFTSVSQERIVVAAASDLKFALDSVVKVFNTKNPGRVEVIYGSSGKLTEQILNGAPFHVFFSADITYPKKIQEQGYASSPIHTYAKGRIVIWSKRPSLKLDGVNVLRDPSIRKIALANPAHAPYGKRAVESLEFYDLYASVKSKLVFGENISQTAQFISTGAADIGIVALSLALSPPMKKDNISFYLIPEESHQPLIQGCVITRFGNESKLAKEFFAFIQQHNAVQILKHFGFTIP